MVHLWRKKVLLGVSNWTQFQSLMELSDCTENSWFKSLCIRVGCTISVLPPVSVHRWQCSWKVEPFPSCHASLVPFQGSETWVLQKLNKIFVINCVTLSSSDSGRTEFIKMFVSYVTLADKVWNMTLHTICKHPSRN